MEPTEQEKARRYHMATIRETDRQIAIIQSLVYTDEKSFTTILMDSGDLPMLTTIERDILKDSVLTETSQELFDRVRLETAMLYASKEALNKNKV